MMMPECDLAMDMVRCTVMIILYERPCHGYAIMELLQARLGRAVSPAIIYPFLASLSTAGYLSSKQERDGKRIRILYRMTPKGRKFSERVFKHLSTLVSTAINPNQSLCAHCGCKLVEPGHLEEIDGREVIFCCVHCAGSYRQVHDDSSQ
jgi:PadR family transcriptional regulator PadR